MSKVRGTRAALREEIISGRWKPGTYLPSVRKLGERFAASKSSIHNILKMLQDEGLLQLSPGRGALITGYSPDQPRLNHLFFRTSDFGTFNYLPVISALMSGVFRGAECKNIEVTISFNDSDNLTEAMINAYSLGEIQGIIYGQCHNYEDLILPLEKSGIPYVVSHEIHGLNVAKCALDFRLITRDAIDYLVKRGHRKIGFWCGSVEDFIYREGMKEYLRLIDEYQLEFRQEWLVLNISSEQDKGADAFFKQKNLPTAVFTMRDYRAKILYEAAARHKIRIPEDISVVSWDNATWPDANAAGLTSFVEPLHELGENSVAMLQQWVTSGERPENCMITCPIIERNSVKTI
ncbi:MAG: substrate-binding domain-containing protein [Victivallaceae bacterium]|jgi:LacI family transcriptional regulator|nr:substrate-binding domain-containing protein [Victivallaceae bacterium]MDD3704020.1 substrate-binding domain-containing protein [Victivallaceae bacterium]MDD4317049.1 substrate-binding domain-containing protein [Victivallaceae bacterium]MDD5663183.1 substrate-binding domain-containing protein [Victivallaceae bacterium]NLK83619.1 substrate-binding domain-containing protein [Lentisphaerota bacterium]